MAIHCISTIKNVELDVNQDGLNREFIPGLGASTDPKVPFVSRVLFFPLP
ncbi:MAG: hypothetical protein ACFCU6_10035 [Balneolaceae bacterium]